MREQTITLKYGWHIHCNGRPTCWFDRIGGFLRDWADRIDGRTSLAIMIRSDPPLAPSAKMAVMLKGVEHMARLLEDSVATECSENFLKEAIPHVFADPD